MSSPLDHPPIQRRLGDFEIIREVGRGGMGVVYEARQMSLNRRVALKVLNGGLGLDPTAVLRFCREAKAAAKLHHTNIVPVYATGEENGTHYYAMELVEGPSLDKVIRHLRQAQSDELPAPLSSAPNQMAATGPYFELPDPSANGASVLTSSSIRPDSRYFDALAKLIADVADALAYAHQHGIIHRDIKPSNLMLSPDGRLSINDFGLARMLEQPGMTLTGEFVGTPAYMSPEQITAGRVPIDHRTDIYSLGATLYEMLVLRPPFAGDRRDQILAQILHKDPKAPRRVNNKVPLDLETICFKAIDKDPDRRYQTADELAADLRRYVNRFAIAARRAGPVERFRKWVKRHPGVAVSLALMVVAVGVAVYFGYRAHVTERDRLEDKKQHDAEMTALLRRQALDKAIESAMSGESDRAKKAIREAEQKGASPGQVCWLRGLVHFERSDYGSAIEEFEQAVALMPESVAARAMLARSYFYGEVYGGQGITAKSFDVMAEMRRLTPSTPEDFLCRGYAIGLFDHAEAMEDLNKAVELRDSPIARAFRANTGNRIALDAGDLPMCERALDDVQRAKFLLPENTFVRELSVHVHLNAAHLYGESDPTRADNRRAALEEAKRDVQALEGSHIPPHVTMRATYFEQVGDEVEALKVLSEAVEREGGKQLLSRYAMALYRQGHVVEALTVLDRQKGPLDRKSEILRPFLLAEHPEYGPGRVEENCRDLLARSEFAASPNAPAVLLFLGKRKEAADLSRQIQAPPAGLRVESQHKLADYLAGQLSEPDFLRPTSGSRFATCSAHFWVGMVRLSEGNRKAAREHFETVVATGVFTHLTYPYCRTFLERMKDPNWPRWIDAKR